MRQLPQSIQPDGIYRSDELAAFWELSREARLAWYQTMSVSTEKGIAKAGNHYITTGMSALTSLSDAGCCAPKSSSDGN